MGTKPGWNLWHGHGDRTWEHECISNINLDKRVNK